MYHHYRKNSSHVRQAIFNSYNGKCEYCGKVMRLRDMHIDHIVPQNAERIQDEDINQYLDELVNDGFIMDSIENYLPVCPACNREKTNTLYTASNLRFYHEVARKHTQDILDGIEKLKSSCDEQFYEPVDTGVWEIVDFSNQRDISNAIMGYRLGPADVAACPRSPQIAEIIKRLSIVDYVVVQGEAGCGKSISVYQAAFDYFKDGWRIYRYKTARDPIETIIPDNTEDSLYIVDDAQRFDSSAINALAEQARQNRKIVFAKTISNSFDFDTILLTNVDAINVIYRSYLSRQTEIIPIVHKCDKDVGNSFSTIPFIRRLDAAKNSATPWQFNYILRGGWNTMRSIYLSICTRQTHRLLAATIAAFQILYLDNSVNYQWLCDYISNVDSTIHWTRTDLLHLVNNKIVLSEDDPRIVHIESAKVILAQFLDDPKTNQVSILYSVIEQAFLDKCFSPLGLVWIINGLMQYVFIFNYRENLITERMICSVLDNLQNIEAPKDRMGIAYFVDTVFSFNFPKNGFWYFKENFKLFAEWISETDGETAYAYSVLINSLYNADRKLHHKFSNSINWARLFSSLAKSDGQSLYSWGKLINRLVNGFSQKDMAVISPRFEEAIGKILPGINSQNLDSMSSFLSSTAFLIPHRIPVVVERILPLYEQYFKSDISNAIYIFDFEFLLYVCGISLLGGHRATDEEKKTSRMLVSVIPDKEFGQMISNSEPRRWHQIYDMMILVGKYDKKKAKQIIDGVNLTSLSEIASDYWNTRDSDIIRLCIGLHIGNRKKAEQFVMANQRCIKRYSAYLACIAPACAIQSFHEGVPIDLASAKRWEIEYLALRELIKCDKQVADEILHSDLDNIIAQLNKLSSFDFQDEFCRIFLQQIQTENRSALMEILSRIDPNAILDKWPKDFSDKRPRGKYIERYRKFLDFLLENETPLEVTKALAEVREGLPHGKPSERKQTR